MAAELSMNGRKKIETIQKEFTNKFNYLTLLFLDENRKSLDISKSLSEVRNVKGTDISINAGLKVNTLEARFRDNYGLMVEVAYLKDGKVMHTKDNVDKTLNEMNRWCEETGCDKFEFKKSLKGDTVLSLQEQLFNAISEEYPDAVAKKMNKDNFMDVHLPSVNAKKGTHIFFNTAKVGIKFGFYCRDEVFVKSVLDKSSNIEEYAQGLRPVGNPLFTDVEEAIEATLEFLSQFPGEDIDEVENRYEDEISENETQENSDESDEYETFIDEDDESGEEEEENDDDDDEDNDQEDDEDEEEDEELTVIQNAQPKKEYEKIEGLIKIISDAPEQIVFAPKEIYNDTLNVDKILAANKDCFVYFPEEIKNSHEAILSAMQNGYYDAEMVGHLPIDDNAKLLSIVEKVPDIYVDIPEDKRTEEITKAAFFGMSTLLLTDSKIELSHIPNSIQKNKNFWKQLVLECCKNSNTLHYNSGYFLTFLNDSVKKFLGKLFSDDKEVVLSHGNITHAEKSLQDNLDFLKQMLNVHPSEIMQLNEFDLSDNDYCELAKIALAQDPYQYQNIKDDFKENIELIESALESKKQCYIIHHIPKSLLNNPELIYKLLENNDAQIKDVPSFVFENEEVVEKIIKIISRRVDCLLYASDRLMLDKNFLTQILDNNPLALIFAEKEILDDIDFIKKYLLVVPQLIKYVSDEVKSNKSLVIELLKVNGLIIQHLDEDLASDPEIYWQALKQNVNAYNHFPDNSDVKENNDVLEYISKMDGTLLQGVSVTDKKVFLQALINSSNETVISDESIYITSDFKNCQKSDIAKQLKLDPSQFYFLEEKDINSDLETLRQVITFTPYPIKWESCRKLLDRKEWLAVLSNNPWYFKYLTNEEKLDEQIIEIILTSNGLTFQLLSQDQRKNKKYITIAANQNIHAWKFYEGDYESIFDEMITESVQKDPELIGVFMKMNGFDKYGNDFIKALALDHQVKKFAEVSIFDHEIVPEDCFSLLIQDPNYLNHDQIVISENNLKAAFKNKSIEKDYDWDAVYENTNSINLLHYALKYIPDFGLYELIKKKDKSFDINKVISSIHIIHEPQFYALLSEENKHKLAPYLLRSNNMNFEEKLNLLPSRLKIDFNLFSDFLKDKNVKDNYSLKPDLDELSNLLSKDFLIQLIKPLAEAGYNLFELDSIGNIWQEDREILTIVVANNEDAIEKAIDIILKEPGIFLNALKLNADLSLNDDSSLLSDEVFCLNAIQISPKFYYYVSDNIKTVSFAIDCLNKNHNVYQFLDYELQINYEIVDLILKTNVNLFQHLSKPWDDEGNAFIDLSEKINLLCLLNYLQDDELIQSIVSKYGSAKKDFKAIHKVEFSPNMFYVDEEGEFTLGYENNCFVSEDVCGIVHDEVITDVLSSEDSWDSFIFNNNWYDLDGIYHNYGIGEPSDTLELPNSERVVSNITCVLPEFDSDQVAFTSTEKGDFVHISTSSEKAYGGWDAWKKYTIKFGPGVFDTDKIKVQFSDNVVEGYTYEDNEEDIDFDCDEAYSTSGKGFDSSLYFNNGKELVLVDISELREELTDEGIDVSDVEKVKQFAIKKYGEE